MLRFETWMAPNSRRPNKPSRWACAVTTPDGRWWQVESRAGAPNTLARVLLEGGVADQRFEVWDCDRGMLVWGPRRLSRVSGRSYEEGASRPLVSRKYREPRFGSRLPGTPGTPGKIPLAAE